MERLVWYASYGSNLRAARFGCYLAGGRPDPAATRVYRGARDPAAPRATRTLELPHRLYFAGASPVWQGATAFVDPRVVAPVTRARAYLVTWEQFEDVVAQENHRRFQPIVVTDSDLEEGSLRVLGSGRYETLVGLGRIEGVPVVTFTARGGLDEVVPAPPAPAYLAMLIGGLREAHRLADAAVHAYLDQAPGCTATLVEAALTLLGPGPAGGSGGEVAGGLPEGGQPPVLGPAPGSTSPVDLPESGRATRRPTVEPSAGRGQASARVARPPASTAGSWHDVGDQSDLAVPARARKP